MLLEVKDADLFCLPYNNAHNISFLWRYCERNGYLGQSIRIGQ
jgi:hypothetical protein